MKNFTFLDLFCGCGGLSLGFQQAGFDLAFGLDFDKAALETYSKNFGEEKSLFGDVVAISNNMIAQKIVQNGFSKEVDVVIGGPPCQGFSFARKNGDGSKDPRNFLFREFVRVVSFVKPKFFVMENVKGILSSDNGTIVEEVLNRFEKIGYETSYKILDASDYGVPQTRERTFFVGNRIGVKFDFPSPTAKNKVTVSDAISDLFVLEKFAKLGPLDYKCSPKSTYQKIMRKKSDRLYNHEPTFHAKIVVERIKHVPQGGNWEDIPNHLFKNNRKNRHSSVYKRLKLDEPSVTIDTGNAHSNYFHPLFHRIPTVREAARLQSFPDRFIFFGNLSNQHKQVGNAVPSLLSNAIAIEVMKSLDEYECS